MDVACWWDMEKFTGKPVGLPMSRKVLSKQRFKNKISQELYDNPNKRLWGLEMVGCFCHVSCARAYNESLPDQMRHGYRNSLLRLLFGKSTDKSRCNDTFVPRALPRSQLKRFGGNLDIAEFRDKSRRGGCKIVREPYAINYIPVTPGARFVEGFITSREVSGKFPIPDTRLQTQDLIRHSIQGSEQLGKTNPANDFSQSPIKDISGVSSIKNTQGKRAATTRTRKTSSTSVSNFRPPHCRQKRQISKTRRLSDIAKRNNTNLGPNPP